MSEPAAQPNAPHVAGHTAGHVAPVTLYDTLSATKKPLALLEPGRCKLYVCGPTVYDMSHIGHARAAVVPDILVRTLRAAGVEVLYVRNITDVEDKIIKAANAEGIDPLALAVRYADAYNADMTRFGMLPPDVEPDRKSVV